METAFRLLVDAPARVIGEALGIWLGALLPLPGLIPGFYLYRALTLRLPRVLAMVPSVLLAFYCMMVLYLAGKWTALTILSHMQDS